jgi:hypothetical protein
MLYLIGGTSRSGKSIISRKLLAEKGIPFLPLDAVVMGFAHGIPEYGIHDKLFPNEIAKRMWKFTKALCETLLYLGKDYVVEGEAILPENVSDLANEHGNKIKACFLGYCETTPEQKVHEIKTYQVDLDDWLAKESDAYIRDHVTNMIGYSNFIREECRTYQMPYFDVSRDFNLTVDVAVRYLIERQSTGVL